MTSRAGLCALMGLVALAPSAARAQRLHVYGPAGSSTERRVIAVLEDEAGACVAADDGLEWSATGAELSVESPAGACATWLRLHDEAGVDRAVVEVRRGELRAEVTVPMRETEHLRLRATRQGRRLRVTAPELRGREEVSGFVMTPQGRIELEADGRALRAVVPTDELLGVVVRSDTMVGVAAVAPSAGTGAPRALVMPADLAVEAGGPPREAAFIVAVDRRGRLSSRLPLNVQSERGELQSLRWVARGIAAVGLSAPIQTRSVDLTVGHGGESFGDAEIDVSANWPVSAELQAPTRVIEGTAFEVAGVGRNVDGSPTGLEHLRARCGDGAFTELPSTCVGAAEPGPFPVTLGAVVDGRVVPLATRTVLVEARPTPPAPAEPEPDRGPPVDLGGYLRGSFGVWERPGGAVGVRAWVGATEWLRVGVAAEYELQVVSATGQGPARGTLDGTRHALGAFAMAEIFFGDEIGVALRVELGGGWTRAESTIDGGDVMSADVAHFAARLAGGPRLELGDARLGLDLGAQTGVESEALAWERSPLEGFVELSGAVRLP